MKSKLIIMKKLLLPAILLFALVACSQEKQNRFIEVTGSAEMTIVPDVVELEIVLTHPGNYKQSTEALDKSIHEALEENGMPKSLLMFVGLESPYYYYYNWWWEHNYHNSKTYKIKLDCKKYNLDFINDIKPEYISNIRITSSTHSKITDYRSDVKVQAMVAAKDKASLLLTSIGEEVGGVLEITEIIQPANSNSYWYGNNAELTSNCVMYQPNYSSSEYEAILPTIKLRYEIKAKFEIL
jgi:uncharacterized protein YggE